MKLKALIAELLSANDSRTEQATQKLIALDFAALEPLSKLLKSDEGVRAAVIQGL